MTRLLAVLGAVFLWALPFGGTEAQAPEVRTVRVGVVCPLDGIMAVADGLQIGQVPVQPPCLALPPPHITLDVRDVIAGPLTDWEGDTFYVVQVDDEGLWYAIAWPGFNAARMRRAMS